MRSAAGFHRTMLPSAPAATIASPAIRTNCSGSNRPLKIRCPPAFRRRLATRDALDNRRDRLQAPVRHDIVRDAVAFTTFLHLVDDLANRPDEDRGHLEHSLDGQALPPAFAREPLRGLPAVLGDDDGGDDAQLDLVESRAGLLTDQSDLLRDGFRQEPRWVRNTSPGAQRCRLDPDDVGLACGDPKHSPASRADQDGRVRPLYRLGKCVQLRDRVKATGEREWHSAEQPLEDLERLRETVDTHARRIKRQPSGLVFRLREAGTEPEL